MDFTWTKNENEISEIICLLTNDPYKKDVATTINACDRIIVPTGMSFAAFSYRFEDDAICSTLFEFKNDTEEEQIYYFDGKAFYVAGKKVNELPSLEENCTFFFLLINQVSKPICFKYESIDKLRSTSVGACDIVALIKIKSINYPKALGEFIANFDLPACLETLERKTYSITAMCINSDSFKTQFSSLIDYKYNYFAFSTSDLIVDKTLGRDTLLVRCVDYLNNNLVNEFSKIGIEVEANYEDFNSYNGKLFYSNGFSDAIEGN